MGRRAGQDWVYLYIDMLEEVQVKQSLRSRLVCVFLLPQFNVFPSVSDSGEEDQRVG